MRELPLNWAEATLGQLTTEPEQFVPAHGETIRYIDIGSIDRVKKLIVKPQTLRGEDAPSRARKRVLAGDTLVSMTRPNLNAVALVPTELSGEIASTGFDVLRPREGIDARWLAYLVRTDEFVVSMSNLVQGALYPAIRSKDVRSFLAPVAPTEEQTRIADLLDRLLARVRACNDRFDAIPALLKRFRQAVLSAALSGDLTADWRERNGVADATKLLKQIFDDHQAAGGHAKGNASEPTDGVHNLDPHSLPSTWALITLRDICEPGRPITYGILKPGPELKQGVPYVRVADFPGNRLNLESIRNTSAEIDAQFKRSRLLAGDFLLSIRGTVGRIVETPDELEGANITQDTARLTIGSRVVRRYVHLALLAEATQARMQSAVRGVAVKGINIGDVRALQVPLPPFDEQLEIARVVDSFFQSCSQIEARYTAAHDQAKRLEQLLLVKAFRGELVPQDPNDESVSLLLARTAAHRGLTTPSTKLRKRRATHAPKETTAVTKSRLDDDVLGHAYLASQLRRLGGPASAETLFKVAELPVADFYKQLAWEVAHGYVKDGQTLLEPRDAA